MSKDGFTAIELDFLDFFGELPVERWRQTKEEIEFFASPQFRWSTQHFELNMSYSGSCRDFRLTIESRPDKTIPIYITLKDANYDLTKGRTPGEPSILKIFSGGTVLELVGSPANRIVLTSE